MYLGSERCILGVKDVFDFVKLKISCNYCSAKLKQTCLLGNQ